VGIRNAEIFYATGENELVGAIRENTGWKYNRDTGELICNHPDWDGY
jgi:hypothetical protein